MLTHMKQYVFSEEKVFTACEIAMVIGQLKSKIRPEMLKALNNEECFG